MILDQSSMGRGRVRVDLDEGGLPSIRRVSRKRDSLISWSRGEGRVRKRGKGGKGRKGVVDWGEKKGRKEGTVELTKFVAGRLRLPPPLSPFKLSRTSKSMPHHGHGHSHSHGHGHGSSAGGGGGGGCGDDHDHDLSTDGEQQSLFSEVDRQFSGLPLYLESSRH